MEINGREVRAIGWMIIKHLPAELLQGAPSFFGNRKKSDVPGLDCTEDARRCPNCSHSKACVCRAVCGRAFLWNRTIPRESLSLRQDNLRSHRPAENEHLAPHPRRDFQSVQLSSLTTWQGPTYNCMRQLFNITLNTRSQWSAVTGARTICANVLYSVDGLRNIL